MKTSSDQSPGNTIVYPSLIQCLFDKGNTDKCSVYFRNSYKGWMDVMIIIEYVQLYITFWREER